MLAIVYEIYDSILAPILFHAVANLFVYVMMDLMPFGGIFVTLPACIFFLLISAVSLILMVKWQRVRREDVSSVRKKRIALRID